MVLFALLFNNPIYTALLFSLIIPVIIAAGVWREWISLMKIAFLLCTAIILINILLNGHGTHVLLKLPFSIPGIGILAVTLEAICFAAVMSLRLLTVLSAFAIVTFTIHPDDLMLSMIKAKLPYKSVLVTSLSTRFIPTLINDIECISDVQRSRGLELDMGNLVQKITSRAAIIIPLLSNSLDRVVQVAEAMETRGFGNSGKRTYYREIRFSKTDIFILMVIALTLGFGILIGISGYGTYQYYPALARLNISVGEGLIYCVLSVLILSIIPLAYLKRRNM
jgi:energy-coupling factor transport system permease protein